MKQISRLQLFHLLLLPPLLSAPLSLPPSLPPSLPSYVPPNHEKYRHPASGTPATAPGDRERPRALTSPLQSPPPSPSSRDSHSSDRSSVGKNNTMAPFLLLFPLSFVLLLLPNHNILVSPSGLSLPASRSPPLGPRQSHSSNSLDD